MPLPACVLGFNKRCFLRSRCSMEMWCLDDIWRIAGIGQGHLLGRDHGSLPRVGWRLLACHNGASPDCIIVVVGVVVVVVVAVGFVLCVVVVVVVVVVVFTLDSQMVTRQ